MPYIKSAERVYLDYVLDQIESIEDKGKLEYCIWKLMLAYMKQKDYNYTNLHNAVYAAIHCGEEFKRRYLDKREEEAMKLNGDIE